MQTKINSKKILNWYYGNKRELPFRFTKDPYKIWISEVMLQQTQMKTAIPFSEMEVITVESLPAEVLEHVFRQLDP